MKRLKDIDKLMPHPDEFDPDEKNRPSEEQRKSMGTVRRMLRIMFLNMPPDNLEKSDLNNQIALKLRQTGDVDFEDAEFAQIFEMTKNNAMRWPGHMHHHIMEVLREAEKLKLDVKVDEKAIA